MAQGLRRLPPTLLSKVGEQKDRMLPRRPLAHTPPLCKIRKYIASSRAHT